MSREVSCSDKPADANNEEDLGLRGHVDLAGSLGNLGNADLVGGDLAVLTDVLLSTAEDDLALGLQALWKKALKGPLDQYINLRTLVLSACALAERSRWVSRTLAVFKMVSGTLGTAAAALAAAGLAAVLLHGV